MRAPYLLAATALAALAAPASADPEPPSAARWVGAAYLPAGRVDVAVVHELRLSRFRHLPDELGDAWATGIDVGYGASDRLTLALEHSARSRGTVDYSGGWCHDSRGQRCDRAYAGALLGARWRALAGRRGELAVLAGTGVIGLGPTRPVVRLGLSSRGARGRWWGAFEPLVQIAFGNRAYGNRDQLVAPVWIGLGRRRAAAWIMSGVRGELVGFGEKLEIPFMLGGGVTVGPARLGVEAGWPQLGGPQNTGNVRHAAVWLGGTF